MLGIFYAFVVICSLLREKFFQEHYQSVKRDHLDPGQKQLSVSPDLSGSENCLQRLSADDKNCPLARKKIEYKDN